MANVFYQLSLIEAYGTGLKKIMTAYRLMDANQLFQVTEKVFKVTLPRMDNHRSWIQTNPAVHRTNEDRILEFLSAHGTISRADVEQMTGISPASAARILKKMIQSGVLIRIGEGKNTKYQLVKG